MATIIRATPQRPLPRTVPSGNAIGYPVLLAALLGYAMLLPPQFNLTFGSTVVPPFRLILIPAMAFIVTAFLRGRITPRFPDALMLLLGFWVSLAMFVTTEASEAFTAAVAQTTDMAVAYFFGRATIRSLRDLRTFLVIMAPPLFVMGAIMAAESISHRPIIQPLAAALLGGDYFFRLDLRLGLYRARGPFPHSILAGMFMASFLPLYVMSGLRGWPKYVGIAASLFSFFSVSSAALLSLTTGIGLTTYNWLSERIRNLSWRFFLATAVIFVFFAEATGAGTYRLLIRYASLNSSSAYNRIRIWQYGSQSVEKHPWFGIGYADWERPGWLGDSVDNFWLLMGMRFGVLPPVVTLLVALLAAVALMKCMATANLADKRALTGVVIALAVFAFGATSVALWGAPLVWFFMIMGLGVSLGTQQQRRPRYRPMRPIPRHVTAASTQAS
jgi:hypothetical protein